MRVLVLLLLLLKTILWFLRPTTIMRLKLVCDTLPNKTTFTIHTTQDPYVCVMYATNKHTHTHTHICSFCSFFSSFWRSGISLLLSKDLVAESYDEYWFSPGQNGHHKCFFMGPFLNFFCFVLFFCFFFSKHPKPH